MKLILKLTALLMLMAPLTSHAFVDLRATYGILPVKSQDACGSNCPTAALGGIGADLIISPPMTSFGFGIRYENLGAKATVSGVDFDTKIERMALIVNYRLIDTILHLGPIFTYGVSHKTTMSGSFSGVPFGDFSSSSADSASIGLEVGIKPLIVIPLIVGAEAGYLSYKTKDGKDSVSNKSSDMDFSGTYMKIFAGINF